MVIRDILEKYSDAEVLLLRFEARYSATEAPGFGVTDLSRKKPENKPNLGLDTKFYQNAIILPFNNNSMVILWRFGKIYHRL